MHEVITIAGQDSFSEIQGVYHSVSSSAKFKVEIYDENREVVFTGFGYHGTVYLPEMIGRWKIRIINRDTQTCDFYVSPTQSFSLK